jgi:hypothetical protein
MWFYRSLRGPYRDFIAGDGPDVAIVLVMFLGANLLADLASGLGKIRQRMWRSTAWCGGS